MLFKKYTCPHTCYHKCRHTFCCLSCVWYKYIIRLKTVYFLESNIAATLLSDCPEDPVVAEMDYTSTHQELSTAEATRHPEQQTTDAVTEMVQNTSLVLAPVDPNFGSSAVIWGKFMEICCIKYILLGIKCITLKNSRIFCCGFNLKVYDNRVIDSQI